jgi:hypothetical protein
VGLHCCFARDEGGGDLLVGAALCHVCEDFGLARAECRHGVLAHQVPASAGHVADEASGDRRGLDGLAAGDVVDGRDELDCWCVLEQVAARAGLEGADSEPCSRPWHCGLAQSLWSAGAPAHSDNVPTASLEFWLPWSVALLIGLAVALGITALRNRRRERTPAA